MIKRKWLVLVILPLLVSCFLSVCYSSAQTDTSVLSMAGKDWSIKVDSSLQTSVDSKAVPTVEVSKAGAEKELSLTLNSLKDCAAGQIEFKVSTQGLSVFKQLPLDKELNVSEYDFVNATVAMRKDIVVVSRPENVVNSFACFDDSGKKVLHIYASKLIDAKGNSVWVDSSLEKGLLTVYLDQKWLNEAVFPVVLDPIFGYNSIGASYNDIYINSLIGSNFSLASDATPSKISVYCYGSTGSISAIAGVHASDYSKVKETSTVTLPNGVENVAWVNFTISDTSYINVGTYWLDIGINANGAYVAFDSVASPQAFYDSLSFPTLPDPISPDGFENKKYSIFLTYTEYVEPTSTPSPSPSPSSTSGELSDTQWFAGALIFILVIFNIVLFMLPFALMRFVFAVVSLALCALAFAYAVPFSPYLQLMGVAVSVLSMWFASRARE